MKITSNSLVYPSMAYRQISSGNTFASDIFMTTIPSMKIYCFSYSCLSFCSTLPHGNIKRILSLMACLIGYLSHLLSSRFHSQTIISTLIKVCSLFHSVLTLFDLKAVVLSFFTVFLLTQQMVV